MEMAEHVENDRTDPYEMAERRLAAKRESKLPCDWQTLSTQKVSPPKSEEDTKGRRLLDVSPDALRLLGVIPESGLLKDADLGSDATGFSGEPFDAFPIGKVPEAPAVRKFSTGATRDLDTNKLDFEAFLSPLVIRRYGEFMHKNRFQRDGSLRDGDNWQRGIPLSAYMKSGWRHFLDWWSFHRGLKISDHIEEVLCAVIFNASGYLHEILKRKEI